MPSKLLEAELKCLRPWVLSCAPSLRGKRGFFYSFLFKSEGFCFRSGDFIASLPHRQQHRSGSLTGLAGEVEPSLHPSRFKNHPQLVFLKPFFLFVLKELSVLLLALKVSLGAAKW